MKKSIIVLISVLVCLFVGYTASLFQAGSIDLWYRTLTVSEITPPDAVFPIVWSALYVLMGVSAGLVIAAKNSKRLSAVVLFVVQLGLNFFWSYSFFYLQNPVAGLVNIALLDLFAVMYAFRSYRVNKTASWLVAPYIIWLVLATYLNGFIVAYN